MSAEVLDLFSAAAGGWSLGMHRAGFTTIAACEVEAWRRALYSENNPEVRMYDDVRTLTAARLRDDLGRLPSIVVGSPPCQDISSANTKGRGVEGERSGLYFEAVRLIGEIRPRWFALENSSNLRTRGADAVLAALEALGYACWPVVVRAGDIGANHERPRAWLIGCDVEQVTDADGFGWDEGWSWGRIGLNLSVSGDPLDAPRVGHEGWRTWRHRPDGVGTPHHARSGETPHPDSDALRFAVVPGGSEPEAPVTGDDARDPAQDGRRQGLSRGRVEPVERLSEQACRDDADPTQERPQGQLGRDERGQGEEPQRAHIPSGREVGLCPPDSGDADRSGPDWSLAHLADHLRLDDGLSAWLAGTRVQVGDGKGQSAASLTVEAFGDAVVPQIPEAIGRAIIRTELALSAVFERLAA